MKNNATGKTIFFINIFSFRTISKYKGTIPFKTIGFIAICVIHYLGTFTHFFETDYFTGFTYPSDNVNIVNCIANLNDSECKIINQYNYGYVLNNVNKCKVSDSSSIRLVIVVKSAVGNIHRRLAIRQTWGYERRFSDVIIKTVFSLGLATNETVNRLVNEEYVKYADIVQYDFLDNYYNNTIKTVMNMKWLITFCRNARFYLFVDDDMYVSIRNILIFLRNPTEYPDYLDHKIHNRISSRYVYNFDLPENVKLYAGNVIVASPQRQLCGKWYVSIKEYPFHLYPPYVSAGAIILSLKALEKLYFASYFTEHFKFDDIYLSILAKKVNIEPFHSDHFIMYKKPYHKYKYNYTIVNHGFGNPNELLRVWTEQKSLGHA